ncbi:hypothetical protein ACIRNY_10985 [Capnocytophaga canimorsus]|uniref:hypothetical protein n=1 Tax=Capnocytophaga canimorsus TaxID=28188 RepID=UPI00384C5ED5
MKKKIFKADDRVFVAGYGWGEIKYTAGIKSTIVFDDNKFINISVPNKLVSFTEYTLQGHSQERPINYEDYVGKWGKFWDDYVDEGFCVSKLNKIVFDFFYTTDDTPFNYFEPLTEEQVKILGLE